MITFTNAIVKNRKVKSLCESIVMSCCIEPSLSKMYFKVRSFSYANDYISKYRINEKRGKNKALRSELKRKDCDKL